MTGPQTPDLEFRLRLFTAEIARWNTQINLVTRVDTRRCLGNLMDQCRDAWSLVSTALGAEPGFGDHLYADLGSGNGLPGMVWACARDDAGHAGRTVLVEPRDKRAWFLRRTARELNLSRVDVQTARWGEEALPEHLGDVSGLVVSLKALRLTDLEVMVGLQESVTLERGLESVTIVRFLEPGAASLAELEDAFATCAPGVAGSWALERSEVLGSGVPKLLLTAYRR